MRLLLLLALCCLLTGCAAPDETADEPTTTEHVAALPVAKSTPMPSVEALRKEWQEARRKSEIEADGGQKARDKKVAARRAALKYVHAHFTPAQLQAIRRELRVAKEKAWNDADKACPDTTGKSILAPLFSDPDREEMQRNCELDARSRLTRAYRTRVLERHGMTLELLEAWFRELNEAELKYPRL